VRRYFAPKSASYLLAVCRQTLGTFSPTAWKSYVVNLFATAGESQAAFVKNITPATAVLFAIC
jgi:hypothetical protein